MTSDFDPSGLVWRLQCPIQNIDGAESDQGAATAFAGQTLPGNRVLLLVPQEKSDLFQEAVSGAGMTVAQLAPPATQLELPLDYDSFDIAVIDCDVLGESMQPLLSDLARAGKRAVEIGRAHV